MNSVDVDKRLQIAFKGCSALYQNIHDLFQRHGIIDDTIEKLEDISILVGGTMLQHPHADHARLFNFYKINEDSEKDDELVGFELNRQLYNDMVNAINPTSSIMIDLSNDDSGFYLAIPKSYVEVQADNKTLKTIFGSPDDIFEIIGLPIIYHSSYFVEDYTMYIIKVKKGCQFVGDFMHAGCNNIIKLPPQKRGNFCKQFNVVSNNLIQIDEYNETMERNSNNNVSNDELLDAKHLLEIDIVVHLKKMNDIRPCARFFCKTAPISREQTDVEYNIYPMSSDCCEYKNYVKPIITTTNNVNSTLPELIVISDDASETNTDHAVVSVITSDNTVSTLGYNNNILNIMKNNQEDMVMSRKYFISCNKYVVAPTFLYWYLYGNEFETFMTTYSNNMSPTEKSGFEYEYDAIKKAITTKVDFQFSYKTENINHEKDFLKKEMKNVCMLWEMKIVLRQYSNPTNVYCKIDWLLLKPSLYTNETTALGNLGVFADRYFLNKELIGIYFQNAKFDAKTYINDNLLYSFKSETHGIINAVLPIEAFKESNYDMAMHMIVRSDDENIVNAYINDIGLVYSTKIIEQGTEIILPNNKK